MNEMINLFKTGSRKTETFNGVTVTEIRSEITVRQSLEFCEYLRGIAKTKGRNQGTINGKALTIIEDWYDVKGWSISISHIYGKSVSNKTNYYTITFAKQF